MSRTLTISDDVYARLEQQMHLRGFTDADRFLDALLPPLDTPEQRHAVVERIRAFQEQMAAKYGMMPDSTELIREDRER